MKKILSVVLALVLALSCAACGAANEDVTITFWTTPVLTDEAKMEEIVAKFEEENPGIQVELEYLTWEGVSDKLQIALSTGDTPDVYLDGAARTAMLPSLGVLVDVDDIYNSFNDWSESVATFGVLDGKHYLIPATQIGTSSITINVSLAKELGVYEMLPEDRISWDIHDLYAFVEAATIAGEEKGIKGIGLYAGSQTADDVLYSLMMSNGGSIIDKETMTCTANSAACVEVIEVLGKIVENGYCLDGASLLTGDDFSAPFTNQQVVVVLCEPANLMRVRMEAMQEEGYIEEVPEIQTYGIPTADGMEMESACWGANGLAIFDNGDEAKIEASKKFVQYLTASTEFAQSVWNLQPNYSPSRNNGIEFTGGSDAVKAETEFHKTLTAQYANFDFGILDSYWSEIRSYFYPELQAVYSGTKTAQEAMDSFAANVDEVLANQ